MDRSDVCDAQKSSRRARLDHQIESLEAKAELAGLAYQMNLSANNISYATVLLVASLLLDCKLGWAKQVSFDGYSVWVSRPQNERQLEQLRSLAHEGSDHGIDFWRHPSVLNRSVEFSVSPEHQHEVKSRLEQVRLDYVQVIDDLGKAIEQQRLPVSHSLGARRPRYRNNYRNNRYNPYNRNYYNNNNNNRNYETNRGDFFDRFQTFEAIEAKLAELAKSNPEVTLQSIATTFENRQVHLVKMSRNETAERPVILIDSGHHAREWISHSTGMYLLLAMANSTGESSQKFEAQAGKLRSLLDQFDFWFVPVVNPDGYVQTHQTNRMWRKNKNRPANSKCAGVDPNRNYDVDWGVAGSSKEICMEDYAGKFAASEPEVAAMSRLMLDSGGRIHMYLTFHSYGQYLFYPYGFSNSVKAANRGELQAVGREGVLAIERVRGTRYKLGTPSELMYASSGGSDDFAHAKAKVRFVYTFELPDQGGRGFLSLPSWIRPVGRETLVGVDAMIRKSREIAAS